MNVLYAGLATGPRRISASSYKYSSKTKTREGERK